MPRSRWSSKRPGVAISTSTPLSISLSWSLKDVPPISKALESLVYLAYVSKFSALKRRHNRANLNRCRCFIACFGNGFKNLGVKVEIGEFGQVSPFNMLRLFGRSYCAARLTELSGRSTVHGLRPKWSKGQGNPIRAGAWWQVPADLRSEMRYKTTLTGFARDNRGVCLRLSRSYPRWRPYETA